MRKKMTTKEQIINKAFKTVGERNDHYGTPLAYTAKDS